MLPANANINKQHKTFEVWLLNNRSAKINLKMPILVCQRVAFDPKPFQKQTILKIVQGLLSGNMVLAALGIVFPYILI